MAMCEKNIDITAKSSDDSAIVSLRQNELICNLRALVAVRFEQAINIIVLVFGGQVLRDVGTIDSHGITSGVTVYVIFRQPRTDSKTLASESSDSALSEKLGTDDFLWTKQHSLKFIPRNSDMFKPLLENPDTLRDMLQSDPLVKVLINENASFRHFLGSDTNIQEFFGTIFNPARIEELGRKRDIRIMRMELVPGSYEVLGRFSYHLRKVHEDNIAMTFQRREGCGSDNSTTDNPQRGRENSLPLPNPWRQCNLADLFSRTADRMVTDMKQKFDQIMQLLQNGNLNMALQQAKTLDEMADNAHRELRLRLREGINSVTQYESEKNTTLPTTCSSLNLSDFMSCNDSRWEKQFHSELLELGSMGHTDRRRNICALLMSFGNIRMAVSLLEKWKR